MSRDGPTAPSLWHRQATRETRAERGQYCRLLRHRPGTPAEPASNVLHAYMQQYAANLNLEAIVIRSPTCRVPESLGRIAVAPLHSGPGVYVSLLRIDVNIAHVDKTSRGPKNKTKKKKKAATKYKNHEPMCLPIGKNMSSTSIVNRNCLIDANVCTNSSRCLLLRCLRMVRYLAAPCLYVRLTRTPPDHALMLMPQLFRAPRNIAAGDVKSVYSPVDMMTCHTDRVQRFDMKIMSFSRSDWKRGTRYTRSSPGVSFSEWSLHVFMIHLETTRKIHPTRIQVAGKRPQWRAAVRVTHINGSKPLCGMSSFSPFA